MSPYQGFLTNSSAPVHWRGLLFTSVPDDIPFRTQWRIALDESARLLEHKLQLGDVLTYVGYGTGGEFRAGIAERPLQWTTGVLWMQTA